MDPSGRKPRPNLLLLVVDALRPDRLGCYGYHRATSPSLDRLAAEGIVFEDACAQASWTLPAVASLLTSSYPMVPGALAETGDPLITTDSRRYSLLPPVSMSPSLQAELRKLGYATLACVGGGFLSPSFGLSEGFDWYWSPPGKGSPPLADQVRVVTERLSAQPASPFFLLLHTYEVHDYLHGDAPCLHHFDRGRAGRLSDPARLAETVLARDAQRLSPEELQYINDIYDAEVLFADQQLGQFLDWLLAQPWGRNTIIVVTSDHGEALGEHGLLHHGHRPYREVVQVPLLLGCPDGLPRGRRVPQPVSLVDLMPTLLELAGAAPPPGLAGSSLLPLIRGEASGPPRPLFAESSSPVFLAREGRWWYYTLLPRHQENLFDLESDPQQTTDVAAAEPNRLLHMRRALASLAMYGSRGYRLVVAGKRPAALALQLHCDQRLSYLLSPTLLAEGAVALSPAPPQRRWGRRVRAGEGQLVTVTVPAGRDSHVILFEAASPAATVLVSAHTGRRRVPGGRFHLGAGQVAPQRLPIRLTGLPPAPSLLADAPPAPTDPDDWGVWLWLPTSLAAPPPPAERAPAPDDRAGLEDQLRALGYLD